MHLAGRRTGVRRRRLCIHRLVLLPLLLLLLNSSCRIAGSSLSIHPSSRRRHAAFLSAAPPPLPAPEAAAPAARAAIAQAHPLSPRPRTFGLPAAASSLLQPSAAATRQWGPRTMARTSGGGTSITKRHAASDVGEDDAGGGGGGGGGGGVLLHAFTLIGKSTRWTVAGLVGAVLLARRDAAVVTFTGGAILNALFGKVLKRIIKEARPDGAVLEDPGMPSSHAMALFYMTAFLTKALCQGKGAGLPLWWPLGHAGTIALILAYVAVASSWRVHSGLHTPAQIIVGACVGSAVGASWHELCTRGELNARVLGFLSRFPGSQVPLPYLAGVMVVGALTVGSVERKIAKAMKRIVAKGKGRKKAG